MGGFVLVGIHDRCQNQNIGYLADFGRLNVDGKKGEVQPASVTGVVIGSERNQQQKKAYVKNGQSPPLLGKILCVDGRYDGIGADTDKRGDDLNRYVSSEANGIFCAGNNQSAERGQQKTQKKQNHIALAEGIPDLFYIATQTVTPF